jgi:hypothetical protein
MITTLTQDIKKTMRGHLTTTMRTSFSTSKSRQNASLRMGVYCLIKSSPRGGWRVYIGASRDIRVRWYQHRSLHGNGSGWNIAMFQVVSVPSSPMLNYIEQITINTAKELANKYKYRVQNKIDPLYQIIDTDTKIEKKLTNIFARFKLGERGFSLV